MSNDTNTTPVAPVAGSGIPAISIRQPWAWLIMHGGKDIENRSWRTAFRGKVLVHAAMGMTRNEFIEAQAYVWNFNPELALEMDRRKLERGGIIGEVEISNCVLRSVSPWFVGPWGFVLANPRPLPFRACRGALGFFAPSIPCKDCSRTDYHVHCTECGATDHVASHCDMTD